MRNSWKHRNLIKTDLNGKHSVKIERGNFENLETEICKLKSNKIQMKLRKKLNFDWS